MICQRQAINLRGVSEVVGHFHAIGIIAERNHGRLESGPASTIIDGHPLRSTAMNPPCVSLLDVCLALVQVSVSYGRQAQVGDSDVALLKVSMSDWWQAQVGDSQSTWLNGFGRARWGNGVGGRRGS